MSTIYVVTAEPYHDNSVVMGVYESIEAAEASVGLKFERVGWYVENREHVVAECREPENGRQVKLPGAALDTEDYLVHAFPLTQGPRP